MNYPVLIVNFKAYEESTGDAAILLAKSLAKIKEETGKEIIAVPQFCDLKGVAANIQTFSQHIDSVSYGSNTGSVLPESVRAAGATGTLLNHSERRIPLKDLGEAIKKAKGAGLWACVCSDEKDVKDIAALGPDILAVEPPELIGSGVSVSKAKPEVVKNSVDVVKEINKDIHVLCGAGISSGDDVKAAIKLGAEGVLVASAIVKAQDQYKIALEMASSLEG